MIRLLGVLMALGGAAWGLYRGHLSRDGALAAAGVGGMVFGLGGWLWGLVLVAFFLSSSYLTRYRQPFKRRMAPHLAKGGRRDLYQVVANGGWAAVISLAVFIYAETPYFFAFLGSLAAANADTWATEIGLLSNQLPRRLTDLRPTRRGASGGVTLLGLLASLTGGTFLGTIALLLMILRVPLVDHSLLTPLPSFAVALPFIGGLAGLLASLFDSLLGARLQGVFYCGRCRQEVEQDPDKLGHPSVHLRGWRWLNNDGVNFLSTVFGSLVGVGLWALL